MRYTGRTMKMRILLAALALSFGCAQADVTTEPSTADAPAPAAMAPTYLAVGQDLLLRTTLVRRTLDDLTLDPPIRKQANEIVDGCRSDIENLMTQVESGNMPTMTRITAVPANLRAGREKLMEVLGPDQGEALSEKLRSLRGEARGQIMRLRLSLEDLKLPAAERDSCEKILNDTDLSAEKLPDHDIEGDEYAAARQSMTDLFARTHDSMARILTSDEQSRLGPKFSELAAKAATTQPSNGRS
jgi:hypothetical protein